MRELFKLLLFNKPIKHFIVSLTTNLTLGYSTEHISAFSFRVKKYLLFAY